MAKEEKVLAANRAVRQSLLAVSAEERDQAAATARASMEKTRELLIKSREFFLTKEGRAQVEKIEGPLQDYISVANQLMNTHRQSGELQTVTDALMLMPKNVAAANLVDELLGEASVASALFTGHTKVDGRLSVQLRAPGPMRTLFAECTAAGTIRGIARFDGQRWHVRVEGEGAAPPWGEMASAVGAQVQVNGDASSTRVVFDLEVAT